VKKYWEMRFAVACKSRVSNGNTLEILTKVTSII